jgi:hypothetical protein
LPGADSKARAARALGIAAGAAATSSAAGTASATKVAATGKAGLLSLGKVATAITLGGGIALGAHFGLRERAPRAPVGSARAVAEREPVAISEPEPEPVPVAKSVAEPEPVPVAKSVAEPEPVPVAKSVAEPEPVADPTRVAKTASTLPRELAMLRRARRCAPACALEILAEFRREFPAPLLEPEAMALAVEKHLAAGDREMARARLVELRARHPGAPMLERLDRLVGSP